MSTFDNEEVTNALPENRDSTTTKIDELTKEARKMMIFR